MLIDLGIDLGYKFFTVDFVFGLNQPISLSFFLSHATAYIRELYYVHILGLFKNTPRRPQWSVGRKSRT